MPVENNVGGLDRFLRSVLAVCLAVVAVRSTRRGTRTAELLVASVAAAFAVNAITCFCGVNWALGADTTRR